MSNYDYFIFPDFIFFIFDIILILSFLFVGRNGVISVIPNKLYKLHTTHSWDFLGLEKNGITLSGSLWEKARFGEDTIIGNIDTGRILS